jgi:hypothetical protein
MEDCTMNDLALLSIPRSNLRNLLNWVSLGIGHYCAQTTQESAAALPPSDTSWQNARQAITAEWPPKKGNLARCISEFHLNTKEAFLFILAGQIETEPQITFTIHELQDTEGTGSITVHLALELVNSLFDGEPPWNTLDLANSPLITNHLLTLLGDGPLPLQSLHIQAPFWSVLNDREQTWPNTSLLDGSSRHLLPQKTRKTLPKLAGLLQEEQAQALVLRGHPNSGCQQLAAEIATLMGLQPLLTPLPLWLEHTAFQLACHYGGWLPVIEVNLNPGEALRLPQLKHPHPVIILVNMDGAVIGESCLEYQVELPDQQQRYQLWLQTLEDEKLARQLSGNVLLSGPTIIQLAESAKRYALQAGQKPGAEHVLLARLDYGAEKLRLLADPVLRRVSKNAVVFPPLIDHHLEDLITRAKRREALWSGLGNTMQASQNSGLRALFVGESGTGKTLAASYLAPCLGTPLYRVDLGAVMNKYIGESEKNLGLLLDQAAASDVILLFDEADSLFGSRTDAKQTGERYANNLTNYLLARIENHPGIVILTTNNRERIDTAFHRRIEIIIDFPQPGFTERKRLWHSHLGKRAPDEEIIRALASHCDLTGGQIRNAVLAAAGTQLHQGLIEPRQLVHALQREYQKLGRSMPSALDNLVK